MWVIYKSFRINIKYVQRYYPSEEVTIGSNGEPATITFDYSDTSEQTLGFISTKDRDEALKKIDNMVLCNHSVLDLNVKDKK